MSLSTQDLVRNRDRLFTLRHGNKNTKYHGAHFVDGVAEPVKYRIARRLKSALGNALTITFYEPPKPKRKKATKKKFVAVDRGGNPLVKEEPSEPTTVEDASTKEDVKTDD